MWWVEIEDEDKWADFVSLIYEKASCPILIGDGYSPPSTSPKYPRWERRIYTKIVDIVGKPVMPEEPVTLASFENKSISHSPLTLPPELHEVKHDGVAAKNIWVIGASLGGPAAVKELLMRYRKAYLLHLLLPSILMLVFSKCWHRFGGAIATSPLWMQLKGK